MAENDGKQKVSPERKVFDHVPELFEILEASFNDKDLKELPAKLKFLRDGRDKLEVEQIGMDDGYMNFIYRISQNGKSVVVKWARLMPRTVEAEQIEIDQLDDKMKGQAEELKHRTSIEYHALVKLEEVVPGCIPKLFWFDAQRNFFIMEYLDGYDTLRRLLTNGDIRESLFLDIARFMAKLHKNTHVKTLSTEQWRELNDKYKNDVAVDTLTNWMYELVFTKTPPVPNPRVYSAELDEVRSEVLDNPEAQKSLKKLIQSFRHTHLCFLHNDPHPGAFMIKDGDMRIIDPEFAYIGHPPREVGYFLGEIIMFYYVNKGLQRMDNSRKIAHCVKAVITEYLKLMGDVIDGHGTFMQYVAGHAGHFGYIRTAGWIPFAPFENLEAEEAQCTRVLIKLLKRMDDVTSIEKFMETAFQ